MRAPWLTLGTAAVAVGVSCLPAAAAALVLDPSLGLASLPRWLTAHLVHHDGTHLLWDVAAFVALGGWLEVRHRGLAAAVVGASAIAVSAFLAATLPEGAVYGGLSGVDAALVGAVVVVLARTGHKAAAGALGAAFAAKLALELASGGVLLAGGGDVVHVPIVHALGAGVGVAVAGRSRAGAVASMM